MKIDFIHFSKSFQMKMKKNAERHYFRLNIQILLKILLGKHGFRLINPGLGKLKIVKNITNSTFISPIIIRTE